MVLKANGRIANAMKAVPNPGNADSTACCTKCGPAASPGTFATSMPAWLAAAGSYTL